MLDLTFGEQVKIILSRKGMTIKELAEMIEERTGKKMSRQNLTQRLGRDNFQEQDMRMIAEILGCPFQLNILGDARQPENTDEESVHVTEAELLRLEKKKGKKHRHPVERDITIGELVDLNSGLDQLLEEKEELLGEEIALDAARPECGRGANRGGGVSGGSFRRSNSGRCCAGRDCTGRDCTDCTGRDGGRSNGRRNSRRNSRGSAGGRDASGAPGQKGKGKLERFLSETYQKRA